MMRVSVLVPAMVSLLAWSFAGGVAAEDATAETEPAGQLAEIPEAGLVMSFPSEWAVDIEMREREDFWLSELYPEAAPVVFWDVVYASLSGSPWCDITWYPDHPMSLAEYAEAYESLMTPDRTETRTIEVTPVEIAPGDAYRFDIYNQPSESYATVYLFQSGSSQYLLQCVGDTRDERDWLQFADAIELTSGVAGDGPEPPPESPQP